MYRCVAAAALLLQPAILLGQPAAATTVPRPDAWLIIHAGTLLAEPGKPPRQRQTIVVKNDRIERIADGFLRPEEAGTGIPADARVIDLADRFLLPGLMDAHVHLMRATGAFAARFNQRLFDEKPGEGTVNAMINARLSLAAGFTALRDVGSDDHSVIAVRNAIRAGKLLGPTILAAGPIVSVTGGHGDRVEDAGDPGERLKGGLCDTPDECRVQVRYHKKLGADLIKLTATGGFSDQTGLDQQMSLAEMQAIVATAHQRGMKVAVHAYAADAIRDAVKAEADSIEHGYLLDDEGLRLMKQHGTFLVPTLTIAEPPSIARMFTGPGEAASVKLRNEHAAFERAYRAGVKIALGTDCGIYPHGRNADELVRMVELGMTPADAIRSATLMTAELLGIAADAGTLATGKWADIIAVKANPLDNIGALRQVDFVMKSGRIVRQNGAMTPEIRFDLEHRY
jgi:imidazolonepropionase-like amidohydrolase